MKYWLVRFKSLISFLRFTSLISKVTVCVLINDFLPYEAMHWLFCCLETNASLKYINSLVKIICVFWFSLRNERAETIKCIDSKLKKNIFTSKSVVV